MTCDRLGFFREHVSLHFGHFKRLVFNQHCGAACGDVFWFSHLLQFCLLRDWPAAGRGRLYFDDVTPTTAAFGTHFPYYIIFYVVCCVVY